MAAWWVLVSPVTHIQSPQISTVRSGEILSKDDLVIVTLEHIDYLLRMEGRKSPFGYAAYSISQLKEPLSNLRGELHRIKGVGGATQAIILEILEKGRSSYYEQLLAQRREK